MYLEFFILISDYFKTLTKRIFLYELLIPIIVGITTYYYLQNGLDPKICKKFGESSLTLLGVLLGFSITIITILTTGNSKNLVLIRSTETEYIIGGKKITLFDLLIINFTYSVVIEIILIIVLLLYPVFISNVEIPLLVKFIGFSLLSGLVIHILLLTMRNLTDFYLVLLKK